MGKDKKEASTQTRGANAIRCYRQLIFTVIFTSFSMPDFHRV